MPPKKKGKKKTKAELEAERIEQEEEERLAQEAEIQRLEEERAVKEEQTRKRKKAEKEYRTSELERLTEEFNQYKDASEKTAQAKMVEETTNKVASEWSKYTECDPLPDAGEESDVNDYISETQDEEVTNFEEALVLCLRTEDLAIRMMKVIAATHASILQPDLVADCDRVQRWHVQLSQLRKICLEKLDVATHRSLQSADELDEQGLVVHHREQYRTGLWVNMARWLHNCNPKNVRGGLRPLPFSQDGVELQLDIPKALYTAAIAARVLHLPHADTTLDGPRMVLGGVIRVDLFELPPPPAEPKPGWVMRPTTSELSQGLQGAEAGHNLIVPMRVSFTLPESVFIEPPETPTIAAWSEEAQEWVNRASEHPPEFKKAKRQIRFHILKPGVYAIVQPRAAMLPFQGWSLDVALPHRSPDEEEDEEVPCVHYTLVTRTGMEVKIEVVGELDACRLLSPEVPGLHLEPKPAGELLYALYKVGVNLMPGAVDRVKQAKLGVSKAVKLPGLERRFIEDVSSIAAAFDFRSTTFSQKKKSPNPDELPPMTLNKKVGNSRTVLLGRETSLYTGGNMNTFDFDSILLETDIGSETSRKAPDVGKLDEGCEVKVSYLQNDYAAKAEKGGGDFDEARLAGSDTHAYLANLVATRSSKEAMDRKTPYLLQKALKELLSLTTPLSFS